MTDRLAELLATGGIRKVLAAALKARIAADSGRYCECAEPVLCGLDLLCSQCLLQNRDQEIKRIHRIVDAHEFVPGKLRGLMCATCTRAREEPRHYGCPAIGRTSWGDSVHGVGLQ